jgi:hypothetical protein
VVQVDLEKGTADICFFIFFATVMKEMLGIEGFDEF